MNDAYRNVKPPFYLSVFSDQILQMVDFSKEKKEGGMLDIIGEKAFMQQYATIRLQFPRQTGHTSLMRSIFNDILKAGRYVPLCFFNQHGLCDEFVRDLTYHDKFDDHGYYFTTLPELPKTIRDNFIYAENIHRRRSENHIDFNKTIAIVDNAHFMSKGELNRIYDLKPLFLILLQ